MNIKEIKEMISLMNEHGLSELELEREGLKIKLKKHSSGKIETITERLVQAPPLKKESAPKEVEEKFKNTIEIKAPMVGTFYSAPSPEAPAYVEIGSKIEPGQVICIIEAMKLMNEIKAEVKGKVVEILAENGNPVEFGQTLFLVEPA